MEDKNSSWRMFYTYIKLSRTFWGLKYHRKIRYYGGYKIKYDHQEKWCQHESEHKKGENSITMFYLKDKRFIP